MPSRRTNGRHAEGTKRSGTRSGKRRLPVRYSSAIMASADRSPCTAPAPRNSKVLRKAPAKSFTVRCRSINSRSEEHTSELQSLMRISYAVFCLKKKTHNKHKTTYTHRYEQNNITKK